MKTIQLLVCLKYLKQNDRLPNGALILAPSSTIGNWSNEAVKNVPGLDIIMISGTRISQRALLARITTHPDAVSWNVFRFNL